MYKIECTVCATKFEHHLPHTKTCSQSCRRKMTRDRYGIMSSNLPSQFAGKLHELKVVIDLAEKGYDVYYSVFPQQHYDLVISHRDTHTPKFVEVKTGYRSLATGNISMPRHAHNGWDVMAIVIRNENSIVYRNKQGQDIDLKVD